MNKTKIHSIIENELMVRADIYKRLISKALRTTNLEAGKMHLEYVFHLAESRIKSKHECSPMVAIGNYSSNTKIGGITFQVCYCHRHAVDFVGMILDNHIRNSNRLGGNSANN